MERRFFFMEKFKKQMSFSKNFSSNRGRVLVEDAVDDLIKEHKLLGYRERTLTDYNIHMMKMCEINEVHYLDELDRQCLMNYIQLNENAKPSTRRTRLKAVRAVLTKFLDRGMVEYAFWKDINIRVDEEVKEGTTEEEIMVLFNMLDFDDYIEFRDFTAILFIWETGIRMNTLQNIEMNIFDFENNLVNFPPSIMKNHKGLKLPFSDDLAMLIKRLEAWNKEIGYTGEKLFISSKPHLFEKTDFAKLYSKRTQQYQERFGVKNIRAHDLRRGFAKRMLESGINIAVVSKALSHSSIATTTKYLHYSNEEVIDELRKLNR